jgi:hypothetical protein
MAMKEVRVIAGQYKMKDGRGCATSISNMLYPTKALCYGTLPRLPSHLFAMQTLFASLAPFYGEGHAGQGERVHILAHATNEPIEA